MYEMRRVCTWEWCHLQSSVLTNLALRAGSAIGAALNSKGRQCHTVQTREYLVMVAANPLHSSHSSSHSQTMADLAV